MPATARKSAARTVKRRPATKPIAVALLDVTAIDPSPENRQADVDLAPLVESVRTYGIQMPIKVRPKGDRFEIVFGERRWRAAKELGLDTIPATIEDLTDEEAQARRVLENTQRKDPHALEEAEAYERLLAMRDRKGKPIHTPESIAKVAGRSPAHVYNRLKLTALAPELRKAFYAGELTVTGAFLIARGIPTALQIEAWARMKRYADEKAYEDELDDGGHFGTAAIEAVIERDYAFRLDGAPFPVSDATLVAPAGPCTTCPKRSVNQPALFSEPDSKDVCTDVACWRTKVAASVDRERREVFAAGGTVLLQEESRRVFNGGTTLPWNSAWIDVDAACPDHPDRVPWRELLGDFCPPPVLAFTSAGKPVRLAMKEEVTDALLRNGIDLGALRAPVEPLTDPEDGEEPFEDAAEASRAPSAIQDPAKARFAADVARTIRQRILAAVVAAAEAAPPDDNRFAALVYETILHGGYHNAVVDTVKRRLGRVPKGEQPTAALATIASGVEAPALRALVLELCLSRGAYFVMSSEKYPRDLARAIETYGIDAVGIERAVAEELGAKRAARLAKARPAGA
ncbi:parB-like partition protein [Anaeromyxobacter dehalogenans 2CP-1]|uniref:ParB-like partition protein n=1 Tax=Anaeromyxobacter dehalogenans (strain ATCC BAA-258 / DSM 21875 / 2CP-1) TaxID=455488 RepID=B8JFN0_ANAD2|nr:ParB/RepB/Spo0J family partition protein [Anaeromyxobacter dehalogenans]ACL64468.1 parB-like partition protein [Anaeromyxobacter dehalogenans 2CP-1]